MQDRADFPGPGGDQAPRAEERVLGGERGRSSAHGVGVEDSLLGKGRHCRGGSGGGQSVRGAQFASHPLVPISFDWTDGEGGEGKRL